MKICADAGGTSIRISYADDDHAVIQRKKYPVSRFPGGEVGVVAALNRFIEDTRDVCDPASVDTLVVSVAGPVERNQVQFRNSDWSISTEQIRLNFQNTFSDRLRVLLINDFEALAYGLATISDEDTRLIYGRRGRGATSIVCGPGTGLGLAALRQADHGLTGLSVFPSEGGHQSFPAETETERAIRDYMMDEWVSYEHILSGQGLQLLFGFFSEKSNAPYVKELSPEEIVSYCSSGNVAAKRALEEFAYVLGSFCGNMVLALGATRGVYLWGGILKSFPEAMLRSHMIRRFHQRGRAASYVADVPVYRIINSEVALRGCSIYAATAGSHP